MLKDVKTLAEFIEKIKDLGFPWTRLIISPEEHIKNFLSHKPNVNVKPYQLNSYFAREKLCPLFQGKYIRIITSQKELISIDNLTDYWTEEVRLSVCKYLEETPLSKLLNRKTLEQVYQIMLEEKVKPSVIGLRQVFSYVLHEARNFHLSWIKGVLLTLGSNWKGKRWLDISAGYGDRLLAAALMDMEYLGFDPNSKLEEPLSKMVNYLQEKGYSQDKLRVRYLPFEDADLSDEKDFDIIFSSPPFFKTEIYSEEETQSIKRYPEYKDWLKNFLFRSINLAVYHLKPGGYLVLYVADSVQHKHNSLAEATLSYVESLNLLNYQGVIGLENDVGVARPCWIWVKS